jgi:outer membrane autotransporter protein
MAWYVKNQQALGKFLGECTMRNFLTTTTVIVSAVVFSGSVIAADYEFVNAVDETGSMGGEHTFLQSNYTELDDISGSTTFSHGLFGFRNNNTTTDPNGTGDDNISTFDNGSLFGTDTQVQSAAGNLVTNGLQVDPFAAAQFGLDNYSSSFSSGAVKNVIVWTDTTCERGTDCVDEASVQSSFTSQDARLSVVTSDLSATDRNGNRMVAVVKINGVLTGFDADGNSTTNIDESAVTSEYKDIVLATGGVLADLDDVNTDTDGDGTVDGDGFVKAFQAAIQQIVDCTRCDDTGPTTAESQESIVSETTRVSVRAIARQVATAISNRARAVATGGVLQAMQDGKSTGINAGDEMSMPIAVWVDGTYSSLDNDSPTEAFDGDTTTALVGVDVSPMNGLVVGVAVGLENTDLDLSTSNGDKETDGFSGYAYAGYQFNDFISVDAVLGYGSFDTDISETIDGATVTGDYDSDRYLGSINLNGTYEYESVLFTGTVGYLFTQEAVDSYTASDGERVDPDNTNLAQGSVGLEVGYLFEQVYPFVRGTLENDFVTESGADSTGGNVGGGLIYFPTDNLTLGANAGFDVGRDDEENFSIGLNARYRF